MVLKTSTRGEIMSFSKKDIEQLNLIGKFCSQRDIETLASDDLEKKYNLHQADVFVLFGGSILYGVDILAQAIQNKIAKTFVIVGGYGHTTATLQEKVTQEYPNISAFDMQEAEIFATLLKKRFNFQVDLLETKSTNCGNNITYLLDLLKTNNISFNSIILAQDATMQRRMSACLKKYVSTDTKIINFATYQTNLVLENDQVYYDKSILGMWKPKRYQQLLMGEIPRLTDNEFGYGPNGKDFIAHVNIPQNVITAYQNLNNKYPNLNRPGNNLYSSKKN